MPTKTYTPLANITLGSTATTVTISSISQAYRDLVLVVNFKTASFVSSNMQFNNDTGGNYSRVTMNGNGSGSFASNDSNSSAFFLYSANGWQTNSVTTMNIMDYSLTDKHKIMLYRNNTSDYATASAYRWASTSAITSIKFTAAAGSFGTGTTFAVYGVVA